MISNSLWNEILLYLSLQRQVHKAFEIVGVKGYSGRAVKAQFSDSANSNPAILITEAKLQFWGVQDAAELLERMALFHLDNF